MMKFPNKWSFICPLIISAVLLFSCSKKDGLISAAVIGKWQYHNSTFDTSGIGRSSPAVDIYDPGYTALLGESLEFRKGDTVAYNYKGAVSWSNYLIKGRQLILIGSVSNDTLNIYTLTSSQLIIGWEGPSYKANYIRQ